MYKRQTQAGAGFDSDTNIVTILKRGGGRREVPLAQKEDVAAAVLDEIATLI